MADRFEEYCAKPFIPERVEYEIAALRQYRLVYIKEPLQLLEKVMCYWQVMQHISPVRLVV